MSTVQSGLAPSVVADDYGIDPLAFTKYCDRNGFLLNDHNYMDIVDMFDEDYVDWLPSEAQFAKEYYREVTDIPMVIADNVDWLTVWNDELADRFYCVDGYFFFVSTRGGV